MLFPLLHLLAFLFGLGWVSDDLDKILNLYADLSLWSASDLTCKSSDGRSHHFVDVQSKDFFSMSCSLYSIVPVLVTCVNVTASHDGPILQWDTPGSNTPSRLRPELTPAVHYLSNPKIFFLEKYSQPQQIRIGLLKSLKTKL